MCTDNHPPAPPAEVLHDVEPPFEIDLEPVDLGGPAFEPLIPRVLDDPAALDPAVLVPGHCTGWRALHAMSARFPDAFIPNSVGTSFHL